MTNISSIESSEHSKSYKFHEFSPKIVSFLGRQIKKLKNTMSPFFKSFFSLLGKLTPSKSFPKNQQFSDKITTEDLDFKKLSPHLQQMVTHYYQKQYSTLENATIIVKENGQKQSMLLIDAYKTGKLAHESFYNTQLGYNGPKELESKIHRWYHGASHAICVAIWSLVLAQVRHLILNEEIPDNMLEIVLAAGYHDSGRQRDGRDLWDRESSRNIKNAVLQMSPNKELVAKELKKALKHKDDERLPQLSPFANKALTILHDADMLDAQRWAGNSYYYKGLHIYKEASSAHQEMVSQLIKEIKKFTTLTQDPIERLKLEDSQHYFEDTLQLIAKKKEEFPLLYDMLSKYPALKL